MCELQIRLPKATSQCLCAPDTCVVLWMQHSTKWSNLTFCFWGLCSKKRKEENHKIEDGFSGVQSLCSLGAYRSTNIRQRFYFCVSQTHSLVFVGIFLSFFLIVWAVREGVLTGFWMRRSSPPPVLPCVRPAGHRGLLHHGVRRPAVLRLPGLPDVSVGHCHRHGQAQVHHQAGTTFLRPARPPMTASLPLSVRGYSGRFCSNQPFFPPHLRCESGGWREVECFPFHWWVPGWVCKLWCNFHLQCY